MAKTALSLCLTRRWHGLKVRRRARVHEPNRGISAFYAGRQNKEPKEGKMYIRKAILGAASALALASPAAASDLRVAPYTNGPTYERETHTYEHRSASRVVGEEAAPVAAETVIVRRPVVVAQPRVVVEEYPVYAAPRVYAAPPVYAYAGPGWRHGWGHRHFHGGW
jgi:hypothetical protein